MQSFFILGAALLMPLLHPQVVEASIMPADPQDFLVTDLEDVYPIFETFQGKMYSGLLPFTQDNEDGAFMFWLFEPDHQEVDNTLSLYLSGGPGCSSIGTGNFFGSGPVAVPKFPAGRVDPTDKDAPLQENPYSWTQATTMLYVEQPATTGFSYGPLPDNEYDVARDMYHFLQNFFNTFTHLKDRDLFLWGGSYSGMNVPALARKIYHENKGLQDNSDERINLKGIALGNAWLDAKIQGPAMLDYAWQHGMIDLTTRNTFQQYWKDCMAKREVRSPMHPFTTTDDCGLDEIILQAAGEGLLPDQSINCYDVTTWDPYAILEDEGTINKFYNNPQVQKALHTQPTEWFGCTPNWAQMLLHDEPVSVLPYIAELLDETDVRILFFNGDRDLLCCHTGTDLLLDSMHWSNATEWKSGTVPRGMWMVDNRVAGYTKKLGNLQFVTVYNSGHMVYYNQPSRCLDMVKRFLKGESLLDVGLPSYPSRGGNNGADDNNKNGNMSFTVKALLGLFVGAFVWLIWHRVQQTSRQRKEYDPIETEAAAANGGADDGYSDNTPKQ